MENIASSIIDEGCWKYIGCRRGQGGRKKKTKKKLTKKKKKKKKKKQEGKAVGAGIARGMKKNRGILEEHFRPSLKSG